MPRPFIPAPNTVSLEFIYRNWNVNAMENVIHIAKGSPFTLAQIVSLRSAVLGWYDANIKPFTTNSFCLVRIRTKALDTSGSPVDDTAISPARCGPNVPVGVVPGNACVALKLGTGLAGRSNRGRVYFPVLSAGWLDPTNSNELNSGSAAAIVAGWATLIAAVPAWDATAHWVVTSFRTDNAWRTTAVNNNVTSVVSVDLHVDSQRRRLTGRGI